MNLPIMMFDANGGLVAVRINQSIFNDDQVIGDIITNMIKFRGYEEELLSNPSDVQVVADSVKNTFWQIAGEGVSIEDSRLELSGLELVRGKLKQDNLLRQVVVLSCSCTKGELEEASQIGKNIFDKSLHI